MMQAKTEGKLFLKPEKQKMMVAGNSTENQSFLFFVLCIQKADWEHLNNKSDMTSRMLCVWNMFFYFC